MRKITLLLISVLVLHSTYAQLATYKMPEVINNQNLHLTFLKVRSATTSYYVNYKVKNTGNGILIIDRSKTSIKQKDGTANALAKMYTIKPGKSVTVYNQFRIKAPLKANADIFDIAIDGIKYTEAKEPVLNAKKITPERGLVQTFNDFEIKIMEYNVRTGRTFIEVRCKYNGNANSLGYVDLSKINVTGGKASIVKKGDIILTGKSYTFAINVKPDGNELSLDFSNVLGTMKLTDLNIGKITVKSTRYKEPVKDKKKENSAKQDSIKAVKKELCALSYNDFASLRADIKKILNEGGKPIETSHKFIAAKGCINTDQIVELMEVFNLDGQKLKFAKMAYKFTSDKHRFHLTVAKLSYLKNKQALEEFLEQQQ